MHLRIAIFAPSNSVAILEVDNGSLGLSRNNGCAAASGNCIATADADDLVSFNYFERMFLESQRRGPKTIVVPKFVFAFGRDYHIAEYFDLAEVTPLTLIKNHPYVSRLCFHRSLFETLQYVDAKVSSGFAYEDWHFICEAVRIGYDLRVAPETILFYRQRVDGLLNHSNANSNGQIPPSELFRPANYLRACSSYITHFDSNPDPRLEIAKSSRPALGDLVCQELILAAQSIEPAVHIERFRTCGQWNYLQADVDVGVFYARLCEHVGDQSFDEVFLLPYLTTGGADQYILNIMREFSAQRPGHRMLVLFGEPFDRYAWLDKLPPGCTHVDLCRMEPKISIDDLDLVCLKLIQACAPSARLHLKPSTFAQRFFTRFAAVLAAHRPVYYRFSDGRNFYENITLIEPGGFNFVSDNLECLDRIICDNDTIRMCDGNRIGLSGNKWKLLYARSVPSQMPVAESLTAAAASRSLLWASRLDHEKRPELLIHIAQRMRQRLPEFELVIYGSPTMDNFELRRLIDLPNVRYHGKFSDFNELRAHIYFCYIYTSFFDGMPNILIEAAESCCPIVAPDVGGISELIRNRETGILLHCTDDDEADAELYIEAIEGLLVSPGLRETILRQAYELAVRRHDPLLYSANVKSAFGEL